MSYLAGMRDKNGMAWTGFEWVSAERYEEMRAAELADGIPFLCLPALDKPYLNAEGAKPLDARQTPEPARSILPAPLDVNSDAMNVLSEMEEFADKNMSGIVQGWVDRLRLAGVGQ